ncbi:MAG: oligosaccharide flippase family protein [Lachnospiraceae bacterium]
MANSKKNSFYIQGTILAAASILTRLIGIAFRIPLTRIIGDEGNGAYSNAYEVYNLALLLSTYSIPIAVSKLVSARESKKEYVNSYRVFCTAMVFSVVVGAVAAAVTYFGAEFFAVKMFKSAASAIPLKYLAPTIFVFAVMGVLRGYFQGKNTVLPTSISQILEQVVHVAVGLSAAALFMKAHSDSQQAAAYGAAGGTFGTLCGALAALAFLAFVYIIYYPVLKRRFRKDCGAAQESYQDLFKILLITVLPIILNQTLYSLSGPLDSYLLNTVLDAKGFNEETRLILWGRYSGKYRLMANVPLAIASAIGVAVIPNIVIAYTNNDRETLFSKISQSVKFNMMIVIPCAFGLGVLAGPIMELLFGDTTEMTTNLMQLGAMAIIFYAYSTTTGNVLQGLNRLRYPVMHSAVGILIYVLVDYLLLTFTDMGVYALIVGHTIFPMIISVLNWFRIEHDTGYRQEIKKTFLLPIASSAVMAFVAYFSYLGVRSVINSCFISLMAAILFAVFVYLVMMLLTRAVDRKELLELPMGARLVRLVEKLGLLRE